MEKFFKEVDVPIFDLFTSTIKPGKLKDLQVKINKFMKFYNGCELLSLQIGKRLAGNHRQRQTKALYVWHTLNDFSAHVKLIKQYKEDNVLIRSFSWYKACQKKFLDHKTWDNYSVNFPQHAIALDHLRYRWELHGRYSHFTSANLLEAVTALTYIDRNVGKAVILENKTNKNSAKHSDYRTYLGNAKNKIAAEKMALSEAMYARFELAIVSGDLTNHDVTVNLVNELQNLTGSGSHKKIENTCIRPAEKFDNTVYTNLYQGILNHGEPSLKTKFNKLLLVQDTKVTGIKCASGYVLAPENFSQYIPRTPKKPMRLFKGHNFRYEFFQKTEEAEVLLKLITLSRFKIVKIETIACPTEDAVWLMLKNLQELVAAAQKRAQSALSNLAGRFRKTTTSFIVTWQKLLQDQQLVILEKKVVFLETLAQQLFPPIQHLNNEPGVNPRTKESVQALINNIEQQVITLSLSDDFKKRFNVAKNSFKFMEEDTKYVQQQLIENHIVEYLKLLLSRKTLTTVELDELLLSCKKLDINNRTNFYEQHSKLIDGLLVYLDKFFTSQPEKIENLLGNDEGLLIIQIGKILREMIVSKITEQLDQTINNFLERYEKYIKLQSANDLKVSAVLFEELEQITKSVISKREQLLAIEQLRLVREEATKKELPNNFDTKEKLEISMEFSPRLAASSQDFSQINKDLTVLVQSTPLLDERVNNLSQKIENVCNLQKDIDQIIQETLQSHEKIPISQAKNPHRLLASTRSQVKNISDQQNDTINTFKDENVL